MEYNWERMSEVYIALFIGPQVITTKIASAFLRQHPWALRATSK